MQLLAGKMLKQVQYNKRKGFTLAEVLVTLAIIGVVASLTIPTLMKSWQEAAWKAAWKKEFSAISQATLMMASDNGGTLKGLFPGAAGAAALGFSAEFSKYIKVAKSC